MTLWILFCRMSERFDYLFVFYTKDRSHAEHKAEELLALYGYEFVELREMPYGFTILHAHLPGTLEEDLP